MKKRLAIIGNGMACGRLLDELFRRGAGSAFDVTVFGEEPRGCYNRILLGRILGGGTAKEITTKPRARYTDRGVTYHSDTLVAKLDPPTRTLFTKAGQSLPYDVAVIATGSAPFIPPLTT